MKSTLTIILSVFIVVTALPVSGMPVSGPGGSIRGTPPAPKFTDAERQSELARRRAKVLEAMKDKSILVMFSAEPRNYTNDVDFMYRQENNLYYLTALKQNGATLVLAKNGGQTQEVLFLPKRNPQFETWNGRMYSNEDATRLSGIRTIVNAPESRNFLAALKEKKPFSSTDGVSIGTGFENVYLAVERVFGQTREAGIPAENRAQLKARTEAALALVGLTGVKTRWRTTWGASHLTAAKI